MNIFKKIYCRIYQQVFHIAIPFMPYHEPKILENMEEVVKTLKEEKVEKVMLATDKSIRGLGLTKELEDTLTRANLSYVVYDDILPNPTIDMVEEGLKIYLKNNCKAMIAFGGGSVMDCAKVILARVAKPKKSVQKMKGLLKIRKKLPLLFAVPTTAGTGSETTLVAVITDGKSHYKYAINDFSLIPKYAVLDYRTTLNLPKFITATTGMDALTHAIEAYIGKSTTKKTRQMAENSVKLIVENLKVAYDEPQNVEARKNMLRASYYAGIAFTISYVGYVHAIAHSLGGQYGVAHGFANAVILPHVLKKYGKSMFKKLGKLAKISLVADKNDDDKTASEKMIKLIESLNSHFEIPTTIKELNMNDIEKLAEKADKEATPLYPVPKLFDKKELEEIYKELLQK